MLHTTIRVAIMQISQVGMYQGQVMLALRDDSWMFTGICGGGPAASVSEAAWE